MQKVVNKPYNPPMRRLSSFHGLLLTLAVAMIQPGCSSSSGTDPDVGNPGDVWDRIEFDIQVVDVLWDVDKVTGDPGEPGDPGIKPPDKDTVAPDDGMIGEDTTVPDDPCPCDEGTQAEDVKEEEPDMGPEDLGPVDKGPCVPDCEGKICGPDGCDGICGFCEWGFACADEGAKCAKICIPDCIEEGKLCGDDGCGGSCGECDKDAGFVCKDDFKCYFEQCIPECLDRECGPDPVCGNTDECGTCGAGQSCTESGHCVVGPCQGVHPDKGKCEGHYVLYCSQVGGQDVLIKIDCTKEEGDLVCGWDPWAGKFDCVEKPPCVPNCTDKECGDDGCDGSCGSCPVGWGCPSFGCRPVEGATCGYIEEVGFCWTDNWLYYCTGTAESGQIVAENCTQQSKVCAYDSQYTHTYQCMNPL